MKQFNILCYIFQLLIKMYGAKVGRPERYSEYCTDL